MAEGGFNFNEWLKQAKEDPKVAAQPLVILIAIIFAAYKFLYVPQKTVLGKELKKAKNIENEIRGLESAVANIEEIKIEVNDLMKAWDEINSKCYKKGEGPLFIQDIRNIGRRIDLNFKSISPLPVVNRTFETLSYELYSVKISFIGTFKQFGLLLRSFETHKKCVFLDVPNLQPDASGTFKFDLTPTTVLLPEREAAPAPPSE